MPNGYLETIKQIINYQKVIHYNNATMNITYDAWQTDLADAAKTTITRCKLNRGSIYNYVQNSNGSFTYAAYKLPKVKDYKAIITYDAVQPGLLFVSSMALRMLTLANQLA